jgi:hypothetical protein
LGDKNAGVRLLPVLRKFVLESSRLGDRDGDGEILVSDPTIAEKGSNKPI